MNVPKDYSVYVLLPSMEESFLCGGHLLAQKLAHMLGSHCRCGIVTYEHKCEGYPFLDETLKSAKKKDIFIVTWGYHINRLVRTLKRRRTVYYAQSFGWDITLPASVPVVCISEYILSQWAKKAPKNPTFLLNPAVSKDCRNLHIKRDIDILVHSGKKMSDYLLKTLLPKLEKRFRVHHMKRFSPFLPAKELYHYYNRSKIYLYHPKEILDSGGAEGFGLPPLEAFLCGCTVFSNLLGGLADYLEPAVNMQQLGVYSLKYDLAQIKRALMEACSVPEKNTSFLRWRYSEERFHLALNRILEALEYFFQAI
jgi:hypothetical protein